MVKDIVCFVDEEGRGRFRCPHCGEEKPIDIATDVLSTEPFTETCTCGGKASGRFSFCTSGRKPERLSGYYRVRDGSGQGDLIVKEVSVRKAILTCTHAELIFPGDKLDLTFNLENEKLTRINLPVVVSYVHGMRVTALRWDIHRQPPTSACA